MSARRKLTLIALAVALGSCSGPLGVQPGDAVVSPNVGDPDFSVVVVAADDLVGIEASVRADGVAVDEVDGRPTLSWTGVPITIDVEASGFEPWTFVVEEFPEAGRIEVRLEPVVLSGRVTTNTGRPLPGADVTLGGIRDTTDNEGRYVLERAVAGTIALDRPAWQHAEHVWQGDVTEMDLSMEPLDIRAVRASPEDVLDTDRWESVLSLAETTGVNGLVVDLKAEDGTVTYASEVETANAIGAVSAYLDPTQVVTAAHDRGLYLIGRIGVFQDDFLTKADPDVAVTTDDGSVWRSANGIAWLDPTDPASYEYSIAIAEEACRLGFDEILFDYVSFPFGGDVADTAIFDGEYTEEVRVESIDAFLDRAYSVLHATGCSVGATIFGIVLESRFDERVGQRPGPMSRIVDVLAPTLYSTNYPAGWKGFDDPNAHAAEIVDTALEGGRGRLDGHAYLRPWLQTWAITKADQRAVQSTVTEAGDGWMLWSNDADYSADALPPR